MTEFVPVRLPADEAQQEPRSVGAEIAGGLDSVAGLSVEERDQTLDRLGELVSAIPDDDAASRTVVERTVKTLGRRLKLLEDAYLVCLGRPADPAAVAYFPRSGPMHSVIHPLLESPEFRETVVLRLLQLFPSVPRGFFVHVPKTAGTTVSATLATREGWYVWNSWLQESRQVGLDELLINLRQAHAALSTGVDRFWCAGHTSLQFWEDTQLVNDSAVVFSTLRHPFDVYVSLANHIVRHIKRSPLHPLSLEWAAWLAPEVRSLELSPGEAARRLLFSESFAAEYTNVYVRYLGGAEATATSALRRVRRTRCSLVPLSSLLHYLGDLGMERKALSRLNASRGDRLQTTGLTWPELEHLVDRLGPEDLKYWTLADQMKYAGTAAVTPSFAAR